MKNEVFIQIDNLVYIGFKQYTIYVDQNKVEINHVALQMTTVKYVFINKI